MGLAKRLGRMVLLLLPGVAFANMLTDASSSWVSVQTTNGAWWDYSSDEPTGNKQLDLLGTSTASTVYTRYSSDAQPGGALAFRVRLGGTWDPSFSGTVVVGIDADQNGSLDLFVGVTGAYGSSAVRVWDVSPYRSNTGPTSTGLGSVLNEVTGTSAIVDYSAVNLIDRSGMSFDIDGDGRTDRYMSFALSFEMLTEIFASKGIIIDGNSPLRYAALTAQDANFADIAGLYASSCSASWASCNSLSKAISATYQPPPPPPPAPAILPQPTSVGGTPEPQTWMMLGLGLAALYLGKHLDVFGRWFRT